MASRIDKLNSTLRDLQLDISEIEAGHWFQKMAYCWQAHFRQMSIRTVSGGGGCLADSIGSSCCHRTSTGEYGAAHHPERKWLFERKQGNNKHLYSGIGT